MTTAASRLLVPGIYAPLPTFYLEDDDQDLDIPSLKKHVVFLAKAGIRPLLAGTMGEGIHLSSSDRIALIKATREALDDAGFRDMPIVAGTGAGSTRETIRLCKEAAEAGAEYVIVVIPGYFASVLGTNRNALKAFFIEVAEKSPIPVIIYNYPGASGGIDLDSDLIVAIAKEAPNTVGVKLTCGNVGKLTRICATLSAPSFAAEFPRKFTTADVPFLVLGGLTDTIIPTLVVRGHGAITGLANLAPYSCAKLFKLATAVVTDPSLLEEANRVQGIVANADYVMGQSGIMGAKGILEKLYGYGGRCRRPLPSITPAALEALWENPHLQALIGLEKSLAAQ
ncbi:dihydrodipicolinate synthetase [Thelephora terrestris]|uniref:Dihydrodipicolinate synthetase n=1 Tax=Thelephora terrestris TaxID=56493 RepID=A0A9P6LBW2_9AGAM|nr:dihydrodipicolinate synthetase [Thelephora terrestris]